MSGQQNIKTASKPDSAAIAIARSEVYLFLARGLSYPRLPLAELQQRAQRAAQALGDDILKLIEQIEIPLPEELESRYIRAFGHVMGEDSPAYEMEYGQGHIFMQSRSMAELSAFYRAFGAEAACGERLDHIATELEFMYFLSYKEAHALVSGNEPGAEVCHQAQSRFLEKHLGCWAPLFLKKLELEAEKPYSLLARLAIIWLEKEIRELGANPSLMAEETASNTGLSYLDETAEGLCEVEP